MNKGLIVGKKFNEWAYLILGILLLIVGAIENDTSYFVIAFLSFIFSRLTEITRRQIEYSNKLMEVYKKWKIKTY